MKTMARLAGLLAAAAGILVCTEVRAGGQILSDSDQVWQVATGIIAADNARDLARALSFYADDAVLLPPNEAPVRGKKAIAPRYEELFNRFAPAIEARIDEVEVSGEWAFVLGRNGGRIVPRAGGEARTLDDVYVMILKRTGERGWLIARLMWHPASPAP